MAPAHVARTATGLSWSVVILAAGTCLLGPLRHDVYRDSEDFLLAGDLWPLIPSLMFVGMPAMRRREAHR